MSKSANQQRRAEARNARHDAHVRRFMAGHRADTPQGRAFARSDREQAAKLDAKADRIEGK